MAGLESVLCTEELERRPARLPDYESENRALSVLAQVLADSPQAVLQTLADMIVETLQADSGGISLLTNDESRFNWPAIAGIWRPHIGKGTPRNFGPCGDVLDRGTPLLFTHFERRYGYFHSIAPPVDECLLVPFRVDGKAVGMVWAIMHDMPRTAHRKGRKFDAEDLRQLESLGRFASVAYQSMEFLGAAEQRHAALNLMEDAVQMQDALRNSEVRYRRLFESSKEGIVILDAKSGKITDANPFLAEMLCYPREKLLGKELWQIGLLQDACASRAMVHELLEKGYVRYENLPLETCGRQQIEVEVVANVYQEDHQQVVQCTIRDITARRQMEKRAAEHARSLADMQRRKDEFLAMLSHELRNPLASVRIAAYLLRRPQAPKSTKEEARDIIQRQVDLLARLVDDLLEVTRFTTGKIRLQETDVDLRRVVEGAIAASRLHCDQKSQSIEIALPSEPVWIHGDPLRLEQVVVNLLNNAHKYTPRNGRISVRLERKGDEAVLHVRDNGIGIPAEMLPTIFELFAQGSKSLDHSQRGLGIGLALVRSLVNMHRGTVEAHSCLDQGSEFIVKLPVVSSAPSLAAMSANQVESALHPVDRH